MSMIFYAPVRYDYYYYYYCYYYYLVRSWIRERDARKESHISPYLAASPIGSHQAVHFRMLFDCSLISD